MDPVSTVRKELGDKTLREIRAFAEACGVNYFTFRKIVSGETVSPSYQIVDKVRRYLERRGKQSGRRA